MSECDVHRAAQVLSGRVGDHNRHNFRGDLEGGGSFAIFFMSFELLKGVVNKFLKVLVGQQCSQSKAYKDNEKYDGI